LHPYTQINRQTWNSWTTHHTESQHHQDVELYRATGSSLRSIELEELGDVRGKTLLHLQCNMGADTLSWAKRGALVTGIDVSEEAIARARALADQTQTEARFIASDLYSLSDVLHEQFDIVFTSYGVLWWLADVPRWAEVATTFVKPGGIFSMVDMHPFTNCIEAEEGASPRFAVVYPYEHPAEPLQVLAGELDSPVRTWTYGLGEVVTALLQAGLTLTYLREHPMQFYQQFKSLVRDEAGWWRWPQAEKGLPLLFSLQAMKPASAISVV
jgi:SAM-dependent methyltransferase